MAKKKDEKDVLVVRDEKTGEISVVAGLNADGTPKRTPAKAENAQSFLQFDRQGDVLDNFFKNFFRQCKEPSRFGFYRIAADQAENLLEVMKQLLKDPEANKELLAPHKVDTSDYEKKVQEEMAAQQTEKQEPQKQENMEQRKEQQQDKSEQMQGKRGYQPIDESKINWQELEDRWGVKRDNLEKSGDLTKMQRMRAGIRRYPDGWGEVHPLAGLLYCADCGSPMYIHRTGNGNRTANFSCSGYGKIPVGSKCASGHWVNADSVMKLIQETLREIVRFSKEDEEEFACIVRSEIENRQSSEMKGQKTRLTACQKRLDELETLLCKIYEDNILGKLPDKRYQILEAQYTKEQEALEAEIDSLQKKVDEYEQEQKSADKFIALVKKYQNFEELDAVMLNQFIYKIFVHERDYKGVANSPQTIEIYFNFVGKFGMQEINSPSEEERAALEEKERLRQKRHEAYLRRKASGWQDAYYQKTKAAKKAGIDAKKEAIRSEDRAKGVYYLPNQKYLETEPKGESA